MKIYLCGFMGSGKSTVLKNWQKDWKLETFDFDDKILEKYCDEGQQITDLVKDIGWKEFRSLEMKLLKETQENAYGLYALGGGTCCSDEFWQVISQTNSCVFWVDTAIDTCWHRVKDCTDRPLVRKGQQYFFDLYEKRLKYYQKAHYKVAESMSLEQAIDLI